MPTDRIAGFSITTPQSGGSSGQSTKENPRIQRLHLLFDLVLLTIVVSAPQVAAAQGLMTQVQNQVTLRGTIRTSGGGIAPAGTVVHLHTLNGELAGEQSVDSTGRYSFGGLAPGRYELTVRAKGFEPYDREVALQYGHEFFKDVYLVPAPAGELKSAPALTDLKAPRSARKAYQKGQKALDSHSFRKAQRFLQAAVKVYPCYARAQTALGLTLTILRKYPSAEHALRKAIQCDPGFTLSYPLLGHLLNEEKKYQDSETVLNQGLRLSPGSWQFYYEMGVAKYGEGQYAASAGQFRKAEEMTPPPPPDVHVKLANAYTQLGKLQRAYDEMAAYVAAMPNGSFTPRVRQMMKKMIVAGVAKPEPTPSKSSGSAPQ